MVRRLLIGICLGLCLAVSAFAQLAPFNAKPRSVRTRTFDTEHLKLELRFDWDRRTVTGTATLTLTPFRELHQLELDAVELRVEDVWVGTGPDRLARSRFQRRPGRLVVLPEKRLRPGKKYWVKVQYTVVEPRRGVHFVVPGPKEPHKHRVVWTQNEPEFARYWIPCYDAPNDRLTSETLVTVPKEMFVLSNGVLRGRSENDDGTVTWHWVQEQDHVVYLVSVVAGTFVPYEQKWRDVPIVSYVPPEYVHLAENSFVHTPAMMDLFSRLIGVKYPWPKYAQICCDEYGGGMEHTSATTLALDTLHDDRAHLDVSSEGLVAHELAHQWWGNLLTCKDWAEIWLNESFATYFATLWTEHHKGWDEATWERYQHQLRYLREARRYRRPIVTYRYPSPGAMFDAHSYPKGGRVLHTLRYVLGDRLFYRALRHYARKNAFRVVETADLRTAIEEATGYGMNWFFDQWIYGAGHPVFRVTGSWDGDAGAFKLVVEQTQEGEAVPEVYRTPVELTVLSEKGEPVLTRRLWIDERRQVFVLPLKHAPASWCFDGPDWVLEVHDIRRSDAEWRFRALRDPHLLCRLEAVQKLDRRGVRERFVATLARVAERDPFWAVRAEAARVLGRAGGPQAKAALLRVARRDTKSAVRTAALQALGSYRGKDVADALEAAARTDRSYFAVAAALRSLTRVAPDRARPLLKQALHQPSYREILLRAAVDGLVQLGDRSVTERIKQILKGPSTVRQRLAVYRAALQLAEGKEREQIIDLLLEDMDDPRRGIRQSLAAILGDSGSARALQALRKMRSQEEWAWVRQSLDDAIERLEQSLQRQQSLERRIEQLERKIRQLEQSKPN